MLTKRGCSLRTMAASKSLARGIAGLSGGRAAAEGTCRARAGLRRLYRSASAGWKSIRVSFLCPWHPTWIAQAARAVLLKIDDGRRCSPTSTPGGPARGGSASGGPRTRTIHRARLSLSTASTFLLAPLLPLHPHAAPQLLRALPRVDHFRLHIQSNDVLEAPDPALRRGLLGSQRDC